MRKSAVTLAVTAGISALAFAMASPALASTETITSPTGGTLPAGVTQIGGIVVDLQGLNNDRVVSQLAASQLYRGYSTFSENTVPGVASGNPLLFGTQTGFDAATLAALGGGLQSISVRISLYDGDTAPGNFDANENTFLINNVLIGNWSNVTTYQTNADGTTTLSTGTGFGNDVLATGFFSSTDAVTLASIYASLLSTNALAFTLDDVDPGDNFFDFTQGINGGLINVGTGPVVTPPVVTPSNGPFNYWDGGAAGNANNGVVNGGDGTWNATNFNWTQATGTINGPYSPNPTNAFFTGTPGVVTVDNSLGPISVTGLTFNVDGYRIAGDALTLAGPTVAVAVGDGTANGAAFVTTIDSVLTGAAGLTKTDLGTLVLNGANTYAGPTEVAGGTLIGSATSFGAGDLTIDAAGRLVINQPTNASLPNRLLGTGGLFKTGAGTLQITGTNSFAGDTSIAAGKLQVDGNLGSSAVTIASGATLSGIGTVGGVFAGSGAIVAPGDSVGAIGTLSVTGPYAQAAGSTYQLDLTSVGANDKINVTGKAGLATGSQLVVTKTDTPRYVLGKRYTVLTANNGVSGRYTVSGNTAVSLFYNLVANYDANNVYLDVAQTSTFGSAGATPNQIAAAGGAQSLALGNPLRDAIGYLQTVGEARAAFDSISGEIHATVRAASYEDSRFLREAVDAHLQHEGDRDLWFHAFGSWGRMNGDGNAARYRRDIGGFFVGADLIQSGALRIGVLGGYSHSKVKLPARLSTAESDDAHVGAYAGIDGPIALRGGASYTFRQLKTRRTVAFTGFSDSLTGKYGLGIGQVFGEVGSKLGAGKFTVEPIAGIAYVHIDSGHDAELGGSARLDLKRKNSGVAFGTLGARLNADLTSGDGTTFALKGMAGWRRAFSNRRTLATLSFIGGSDFTVAAPPIAKDVAALEGGVEGRTTSGTVFGVSYSGQIGDRLADHGVRANVSIPF